MDSLDIFLAVLFSVLAVVFFMGKGKGLLDMFGGKTQNQKKRTAEEQRAYERMIGFFMLPLAVVEIINLFVQHQMMGLVLAAVAVVDLVIFAKKSRDL